MPKNQPLPLLSLNYIKLSEQRLDVVFVSIIAFTFSFVFFFFLDFLSYFGFFVLLILVHFFENTDEGRISAELVTGK